MDGTLPLNESAKKNDGKGEEGSTSPLNSTKFYDSFFTREYGRLETLRSDRYSTPFSILLISVEPTGGEEDKHALVAYMKEVVKRLLCVVRDCDVVGMVDKKKVTIILPETDYFGSLVTLRKVSRAIDGLNRNQSKAVAEITLSEATFPKDAKNYEGLLDTAVHRIQDKKDSVWETLNLKNTIFWESIGSVLNHRATNFKNSNFDIGMGSLISDKFIEEANTAILTDLALNPKKKGILYLTLKGNEHDEPVIRTLERIEHLSVKIFLICEDGANTREVRNGHRIIIDDPRLQELHMTFLLSEDSSYALICRESWGGSFTCFHTSDTTFVEGVITKLQSDFSLQELL